MTAPRSLGATISALLAIGAADVAWGQQPPTAGSRPGVAVPVGEAAPPVAPFELARRLAERGPRVPESPAHDAAIALLVDRLRGLGLDDVRVVAPAAGLKNVEATLAGADPAAGEIVLAAHYDTVAGSPGAADDASGCAVILAAVADLERIPLRRSLRVLFFDGEEAGLRGSRAWTGSLTAVERERILASVHLDVVGIDRDGPAVALHEDVGEPRAPTARTPAWLVHAVLRAGSAVGFRFRVGDHVLPLAAQVLTRTVRVPWSSDAAAVLAGGIPAVLLTDFSALHPYDALHTPEDRVERLDPERLARWSDAVAAVVRRLDALEGRPRWEDEFLVLGGRVWIRRDLLWIGLALWIVLVVRGRPGRWAGARAEERRARGRGYLPGYVFRFGFLAAAIWIPALALPLLYPMAPLGLITPRTTAGKVLLAAVAALPLVAWLATVAVAAALGLVAGWNLAPGRTALLLGTAAAFGWQLWSGPDPAPPAEASVAAGAPPSP